MNSETRLYHKPYPPGVRDYTHIKSLQNLAQRVAAVVPIPGWISLVLES
jgi:hypothetical protein